MTVSKLRVLVVDDSAFSRRTIISMLESIPNVDVIGYALDGEDGLRKVIDLKPDLITLDLEMPRMDGFSLLRIIMQQQPTPVIVVSSRAEDDNVFKALELGAVEFVPKPTSRISKALMGIKHDLVEKVSEVKNANLNNILTRANPPVMDTKSRHIINRRFIFEPNSFSPNFPMVVIGSSTGGPPALQQIFSSILNEIPVAFAVAQHMPAGFTRAFAERLNRFSPLTIYEAKEGDVVKPGEVLIAPGGKNLGFCIQNGRIVTEITDPTQGQRCLPSVDHLFSSASSAFRNRLLGVVLTGMGSDGSAGVKMIKEKGGSIFAESEESCVVFGMPKMAIASGCVDLIVPLPAIYTEILRYLGY
jgi:two-component system chemotaxis response regulator CheB